ncbi:hypothetical protein EJB05_10177, partial [Eragrostis curvula]
MLATATYNLHCWPSQVLRSPPPPQDASHALPLGLGPWNCRLSPGVTTNPGTNCSLLGSGMNCLNADF